MHAPKHKKPRFLPQTLDEFQAYFDGTRQPRPKILIHPETGEYYRLISPLAHSDYGQGSYEQFTTPTTEVHYYEMDAAHLAKYKEMKLNPLPAGFHIKELHLQSDSRKSLAPDEISPRQLYELLNAIGNDSGWWPVDDPNYRAEEYFSKLKINVLFDRHKPVAARIWNETLLESKHEVAGAFLGVVPEYRGQGFGGYMMKWGLKHLAERDCQRYYLNTGDDDMMPANGTHASANPARVFYERLGFEHKESVIHSPQTMMSRLSGKFHPFSELTMGDSFYCKPHGQLFGKFTAEAINKRLARAFPEKSIA